MQVMQFTPQRLERVHRVMQKEELDAILITRRPDVQYLTGYQSPRDGFPVGCLLPQDSPPQLLVPSFLEESISIESTVAEIKVFEDELHEDWYLSHNPHFWKRCAELVKSIDLSKGIIGLQLDRFSVSEFEQLKTLLPDAGFKDFSKTLWRLRQIKDATEIEAIRQAVSIAEIGMRTAFEIVAAGKAEDETSIEIESAMRSAGGQLHGILAAVQSGKSAHYGFMGASNSRVGTEEPVVIDIRVSQFGYFAEITRTLHTGRPTDEQRTAFDSVVDVSKNLERSIEPGKSFSEVVSASVEKSGYQEFVGSKQTSLGCSIGLDLKEPPRLHVESVGSFREGMVFSIHPHIYSHRSGTVKVTDLVLVTAEGCENLCTLPRETL